MKNYTITVNGTAYDVTVEEGNGAVAAPAAPKAAPKAAAAPAPAIKKNASTGAGAIKIEAGAAGKVWKILKKPGDKVEKGETAVILEAMKMEIPMVATVSGVVNTVFVSEGQPVEAGDKLLTIE